jgi:hypothetical protein
MQYCCSTAESAVWEHALSLTEYLYVDTHRLDSYFEQISSPVSYDKVPVWKAGLSITTLGADGTQTRHPRPPTTHEKSTKLTEYLQDKRLVVAHQPTDAGWTQGKEYHVADLQAIKVFIPPKPELYEAFDGATLWLSSFSYPDAATRDVCLVLLEDFQGDDTPPGASDASAFSSLSVLNRSLREYGLRQVDKGFVHTKSADVMRGRLSTSESHWFAGPSQTIAYLSQFLDAQVLTERSIHCLFRVRREIIRKAWLVFGYPIVITAAAENALMPAADEDSFGW